MTPRFLILILTFAHSKICFDSMQHIFSHARPVSTGVQLTSANFCMIYRMKQQQPRQLIQTNSLNVPLIIGYWDIQMQLQNNAD